MTASTRQWPQRSLTHTYDPEDREDRFCVTSAGQCLGYARVTDRGDEIWIDEIAVHPDHRDRGIGTVLLDAVLAHHDGRRFALSCDPYTPDIWADPESDSVGGMGWDALSDWYAGRGFRHARGRGENCCMIRDELEAPPRLVDASTL